MTSHWNELEGASLGRHWLKVCLASSPDDAWYLTRYDTTRDAAVRVVPASAPGADQQLEMWSKATAIDHPHIVRMLDAGRATAEGAEYIYSVSEYPDDFLAAALVERPLAPAEAREVLNAALSALGWIHDHGMVHGAVDTGHIMAFGDTIKLPSDTILPAAPGRSPSSDMHSLGVLLHEILTRDVPRADAHTDFSYLPEPFRSIIRHTVKPEESDLWSVRDVETHLNPPPPKPVPIPAPIVETVSERIVEDKPAPPPVESRPSLPPPHPRSEPVVERSIPFKWVPVAGLAAAVALGAVFLRHPDQPVETAAPPAVVHSAPAPVKPPVTAPAPTPKPAATQPAPIMPPPPKPSAMPRNSRDRSMNADARPSTTAPVWRVVAYTYNGRNHAEQKAKTLNEKHPHWKAEVFAPKGDSAPFFVALGGRMTLSEAQRLQKEARAKGAPRDTFVRNFSN